MTSARAIIFDLDDTLYPERAYAFSGFDAVAAAFGTRLGADFDLSRRMRELFETPDRPRLFDVIAKECHAADAEKLVSQMTEVFRSHAPNIHLRPDADAALSRLRPSHKLGLITDGFAVAQYAKIKALHLRSRLDKLIVTDDWGREFWKPHPRAFQEMALHFDLEPERCTYVADNPSKDFPAPNALGWRTVFIKRPDGIHAGNPACEQGAPHEIITTLDEL